MRTADLKHNKRINFIADAGLVITASYIIGLATISAFTFISEVVK